MFFNKAYNDGIDVRVSYNARTFNSNDTIGVADQSWMVFSSDSRASLTEINYKNISFKLVMLNFEKQDKKDIQNYLVQLQSFVMAQDVPVVIVGDFGVSVWQPEMKKFLENTNLKILNRLIFAKQGSRGNYFDTPSFYVLAFDGFSIKDLVVNSPTSPKDYPLINITLGIKES